MAAVAEFFAMGGYAPYVWGAWGLTVVVLAGNWWAMARAHEAALRTVRETRSGQ